MGTIPPCCQSYDAPNLPDNAARIANIQLQKGVQIVVALQLHFTAVPTLIISPPRNSAFGEIAESNLPQRRICTRYSTMPHTSTRSPYDGGASTFPGLAIIAECGIVPSSSHETLQTPFYRSVHLSVLQPYTLNVRQTRPYTEKYYIDIYSTKNQLPTTAQTRNFHRITRNKIKIGIDFSPRIQYNKPIETREFYRG